MPADDFGVDIQKSLAYILGEGKVVIPVATIEIVVKNAANAAGLLTMRDVEIFIAPFFKFRVISIVMGIASAFVGSVKVGCILFHLIHGVQIPAATKPAFGG